MSEGLSVGLGPLRSRHVERPLVGGDGTIYFATEDTRVFAVAPNGQAKWSAPIGAQGHGLALGADGTLYVGAANGVLYAFAP